LVTGVQTCALPILSRAEQAQMTGAVNDLDNNAIISGQNDRYIAIAEDVQAIMQGIDYQNGNLPR